MAEGTIKKIVSDRGFGFISGEDGKEYFFHRSAIANFDALRGGERVSFEPASGRQAWVHLARGAIELNGEKLSAGDGASVSGERVLSLQGVEPAEVLLFDLA